jgi:serine/threonine-protein kinase
MSVAMGALDRPVPQAKDAPLESRIRPNDVIAGKYRVEGIIGSGGMGLVVSAKHIAMGSRVAIKLLRLEDEADPKGAISRFVREARAIARIQSDHVVRVIDVAALPDGTPYMVMEYLEGRDLKHLIAERDQLPIPEAIGYVLQACEGLAEAHAAGVIHRDLKPSNLFLAEKANRPPYVKVLDFGIAKLLPRPGEVAATTTASLMGSPLYMAPEQMKSSGDIDARVDVWSLGLILYELLAGDPAFGGSTIPEVCMNVMSADPLPISRYRSDVPRELEEIIVKALSKNRDHRYPTMGELARALEKFTDGQLQVHAARASAAVKSLRDPSVVVPDEQPLESDLPRAMDPPPPEEVVPPPPPRPKEESVPAWVEKAPRPPSRRKVWMIAALGLAAFVLGFAAVQTTRHAQPASVATSAPGPAPSAPAAPAAAAPSSEITSVPFDALPVAKKDPPARVPPPSPPPAPAAHAKGAPAPAAPPVAPAPHATSTPAPAPSAGAKDDWKWGDRN